MLRITASKNTGGIDKYFEDGLVRSDYYTGENVGLWSGKLAERLELSGAVTKADFIALCNNRHPREKTQLNPRNSPNRKVYYDFTFSVPKTVSVAYALNKDERIRDAFEKSVAETMQELEQEMCTQKGQGKDKHYAPTKALIYAAFTHKTTRPVNGVPDPHLHRHCIVFNTTWNSEQNRFQAGEFGNIKQKAVYYEAAFESRMAKRLQEIGYGIERRGLSYEVKGISEDIAKKFSRRTILIEKRQKRK